MRYTPMVYNSDFMRAYRKGKSHVRPQLVVYINKNRTGHTRIGITASKKVGGAVQRNRARRVIRHALYEVLPADIGGLDIIVVARGQTTRLKSTQLVKVLHNIFLEAGILKPQEKSET